MTHYIIDTYNLVHMSAGVGGMASGMTVRKLCQFITAAPGGMRATLVLDGRAKPDEPSIHEFPDITLVYSGVGVTADAVIGERVERARGKKKVTVVSNDRAVIRHARTQYAGVMSCEAFLKGLMEGRRGGGEGALPANKTGGTQTTGEAEHWMKEFGLEVPDESAEGEGGKRAKKNAADAELGGLDIEGLLGPPGEG